jgi:hypothetical protein
MELEQEKVLSQDNPEMLGEQAASPPAPEETPAPPPENVPYSRFQEQTQKKNEYKTEVENLKQQMNVLNMQLLKQNQPAINQQPQQVQEELPAKPNPSDFADGTYDEKYIEKLSNYHYKMNKMKEQSEASQRAQAERDVVNAQQHNMRAALFQQQNPDYFVVAENNPYVSQYPNSMRSAIVASDKSPEIAYHLGKNPTEALRIANSPNPSFEIGKIAAKLSTDTTKKQVSMAPQPITPVGNTNTANEKQPGQDKMSYDEYKAKMNAKESSARQNGTWGR